jgi:uncharacterized repeat protein (TIGR01451 family)
MYLNQSYVTGTVNEAGINYTYLFSGISLPAHSSGYFLLTGKILNTDFGKTINQACILLNNKKVTCDQVMYNIQGVRIEKYVDKENENYLHKQVTVKSGDTVVFTLRVMNNGTLPISGFTVKDVLPSYLDFVSVVSAPDFVGGPYDPLTRTITWTYQNILQTGQHVDIKFKAKITMAPITQYNRVGVSHPEIPGDNCTGSTLSNGVLTGMVNCDDASVITTVPEPPVCNSAYNGHIFNSLPGGNYLCSVGTISNFVSTTNGWTWRCNGQAGTTPVQCSAYRYSPPNVYCGDGIRNNNEECDYNDPTHNNRGRNGCGYDCKQRNGDL